MENITEKYINKIALYEVDLIKVSSVIDSCVRLLKVEGLDTKQQVLDMLEETYNKILKGYRVSEDDNAR